jgi:hypothetical protein
MRKYVPLYEDLEIPGEFTKDDMEDVPEGLRLFFDAFDSPDGQLADIIQDVNKNCIFMPKMDKSKEAAYRLLNSTFAGRGFMKKSGVDFDDKMFRNENSNQARENLKRVLGRLIFDKYHDQLNPSALREGLEIPDEFTEGDMNTNCVYTRKVGIIEYLSYDEIINEFEKASTLGAKSVMIRDLPIDWMLEFWNVDLSKIITTGNMLDELVSMDKILDWIKRKGPKRSYRIHQTADSFVSLVSDEFYASPKE